MIKYDLQESNYMEWKGKMFKQIKGIAMGSPISCIYARIYTDLYITLNEDIIKKADIRKFSKYVDDLIFIAKGKEWKTVMKGQDT